MRKPEFSLAPILMLTGVAWFTTSGANAPTTIADPPGTTVSGPADLSAAEKAVAARKERIFVVDCLTTSVSCPVSVAVARHTCDIGASARITDSTQLPMRR